MKIFCAILIILLAGSIAKAHPKLGYEENEVIPRSIIEDIINKTLEVVRAGLPEPIVFDDVAIAFPDESGAILVGGANYSQLQISGIKTFQLTELVVDIFGSSTFTLKLPSININNNYWLDLLFFEIIPFYGSGRSNLHFVNGLIKGSGKVNRTDSGISVSDTKVQLDVDEAIFDVHGLLDDESFSLLLSEILNDVAAPFINEHQDLISRILSPICETIINQILNPS